MDPPRHQPQDAGGNMNTNATEPRERSPMLMLTTKGFKGEDCYKILTRGPDLTMMRSVM